MKRNRKFWGRALILFGVSAWLPYFVLKFVMGHELPVPPFLIAHLSGVIPGFLLVRGEWLLKRLRRNRPNEIHEE